MSRPPLVTITYEPAWRARYWADVLPARPAWFVTCTAHPKLGKDGDGQPWGYAGAGIAKGVKTRHLRAKHGG